MSTLLYNPDRKSKEQLISEFVVRTQVYEDIMHDLETSKMEYPEQHYLLVGQRGAGKTTLLNRLKYGIQDCKQLQDKVIPVLFNEEQYNISELANLWENVAQFLEDYHGFTGVSEEIEKYIGKKNFEELSYDILESYLQKHNKRLILLIDNIGDLLKKLAQIEVRRLREILQTKKEIRLVAGSPFYLETILDYHQPLFEFFKVIRLDGLNEKETRSLLLKLGEINNENDKIEKIINETPERIETLRTLTGGVPRTIALLYRIFTDYNDESTLKDLERILDAVTPLYKHRMDDLPVQQQKIVDAVAKSWDAISVKDLKGKVRIDSKNISAQLRQLEKNQVIEKKETGKKNHFYFVKERFFNIWYLMRYGRKDDKQRVIWLVKFLENWCSENDLKSRIINYIEKIKSGELDSIAVQFYGNVYTAFTNVDLEVKLLLKKITPENISNNVIISDDELHLTMEKYHNDKEWEKILKLAVAVEKLDDNIKAYILHSVIQLSSYDRGNEILLNIYKTVENSEQVVDGTYKITFSLMEAEIFKSMMIEEFYYYALIDLNAARTRLTIYLKCINEEDFNDKSFESIILMDLFCYLLALKGYNLVYQIFLDIKHLNLIDLLRPIYYATIYLKDGADSMEFLKAGPELFDTITKVIEKVDLLEGEIKH